MVIPTGHHLLILVETPMVIPTAWAPFINISGDDHGHLH